MIIVTRIRIQYLNGTSVTEQEGGKSRRKIKFNNRGELEAFRSEKEAAYQDIYNRTHPGSDARVSVLFDTKEK